MLSFIVERKVNFHMFLSSIIAFCLYVVQYCFLQSLYNLRTILHSGMLKEKMQINLFDHNLGNYSRLLIVGHYIGLIIDCDNFRLIIGNAGICFTGSTSLCSMHVASF